MGMEEPSRPHNKTPGLWLNPKLLIEKLCFTSIKVIIQVQRPNQNTII